MRTQCAQAPVDCWSSQIAIPRWAILGIIFYVAVFHSQAVMAQNANPMGDAPVIQNFTAINLGGDEWELQGQVIDDEPGGLTVNFSGAVDGMAVTEADGSFSFTFSLPPNSGGTVDAVVSDDEALMGWAETYVFNF